MMGSECSLRWCRRLRGLCGSLVDIGSRPAGALLGYPEAASWKLLGGLQLELDALILYLVCDLVPQLDPSLLAKMSKVKPEALWAGPGWGRPRESSRCLLCSNYEPALLCFLDIVVRPWVQMCFVWPRSGCCVTSGVHKTWGGWRVNFLVQEFLPLQSGIKRQNK